MTKTVCLIASAMIASNAAVASSVDTRPAQLNAKLCEYVKEIPEGFEIIGGVQALPAMYLPAGFVIRIGTMGIIDFGVPVDFVELIKNHCAEGI